MVSHSRFPIAVAVAVIGSGIGAQPIQFVDRGTPGDIDLGSPTGGIAVLDHDGDGYYDLFLADTEGALNRLFRNVPDPAFPRNRTFADVTAGSGLDDADGTSRGSFGVLAGDYDRDGDPDLYLLGFRHSDASSGLLYRNDGDGQFTNVTLAAGLRFTGYSPVSASWNDFDLDGYLDLFICCWEGSENNFLFMRNEGDGTFTEVTDLLPPMPEFRTAYSHLWLDYDEDGYSDCFVLVDIGPSALFKNIDDGQGGRTFINIAASVGYTGLGNGPMGIAAGDFDGDGDFDLGISTTGPGSYYQNLGGTFQAMVPFSAIWGWGVAWLDPDNDGDLEFYMAGSWAGSGGGPNFDKLFRNLGGGAFDDISVALDASFVSSRHSVLIDFDNDGRQDLITANPGAPGESVSVYQNLTRGANHWIAIRLIGDSTMNSEAIGAVVRLTSGGTTQIRQVVSGSSTAATEDPRCHFGLGSATTVDEIEVRWPRPGAVEARTELFSGPLAVDQILVLSPQSDLGFVRGDCNGDGSFNIADAITLLDDLFGPGVSLGCEDACDANDDGGLDIADAIHELTALFSMGPMPASPSPRCGEDPTDDALACPSFSSCP